MFSFNDLEAEVQIARELSDPPASLHSLCLFLVESEHYLMSRAVQRGQLTDLRVEIEQLQVRFPQALRVKGLLAPLVTAEAHRSDRGGAPAKCAEKGRVLVVEGREVEKEGRGQ